MSNNPDAEGEHRVGEHPVPQFNPRAVVDNARANQSNKPVNTVRCVVGLELSEDDALDNGTPEQRRRAFAAEFARIVDQGAFADVSYDELAFDLAGREPTTDGHARYILELVFNEEWPSSERSDAEHRGVLARTLLEAVSSGFLAGQHRGPVTITVPSRTVIQVAAAGDPDSD